MLLIGCICYCLCVLLFVYNCFIVVDCVLFGLIAVAGYVVVCVIEYVCSDCVLIVYCCLCLRVFVCVACDCL